LFPTLSGGSRRLDATRRDMKMALRSKRCHAIVRGCAQLQFMEDYRILAVVVFPASIRRGVPRADRALGCALRSRQGNDDQETEAARSGSDTDSTRQQF
jgi:hypothetical protein